MTQDMTQNTTHDMSPLRAAAVQFNHQPGDKAANLQIMQRFVTEAHEAGVDLLVFPEMCITGYWHVRNLPRADVEALAEAVPDGPSTQRLIGWAQQTGMSIGAGLIERDAEGRLFNGYVVATPDGQTVCHRKLHCFISEHLDSGDHYTVFDLPHGVRAAVLTCYDNNIQENARAVALHGAQVLLAPHQTGGCNSRSPHAMKPIDVTLWQRRDDPQVRAQLEAECRGDKGRGWVMRWLPARAHDNGLFVIFANGVGQDDDEVRTGHSMILDPYGRVLAEATRVDDELVVSDLDPELRHLCTGVRWLSTRRPELYTRLAQQTGRERPTREVRFSTSF